MYKKRNLVIWFLVLATYASQLSAKILWDKEDSDLKQAEHFIHVESDFYKANEFYQRAANRQNGYAKAGLAVLISRGQGVFPDKVEAKRLAGEIIDGILARVKSNDSHAMFYLGRLYQFGIGIEANTTKAFELQLKAAKMGDPHAMIAVGYYYSYGIGVKQNFTEEEKWYDEASRQGIAIATNNIGVNYSALGKHKKALEGSCAGL